MNDIAFFDIDNTIIRGQSQKILIRFLFDKKYIGVISLLKIYIWFLLYRLNIVKNPKPIMEQSLNKIIKNKSVKEVADLMNIFYHDRLVNYLNHYILRKIQFHISDRDKTVIISNVFYPLAEVIAKNLNINGVISTKMEVIEGKYSGNIIGDIVYGKSKTQYVKDFIGNDEVFKNKTYYYADHFSDLSLLESVKHPVAVNPDYKLYKIAKEKKWEIITE